jgi:hypothetical protein
MARQDGDGQNDLPTMADLVASLPKIDRPTPKARLARRAADIRMDPPDRVDFLHSVLCQTGLPYRNPGDDVRVWQRRQGAATLRIEAGAAIGPDGDFHELGLPYGEKPRLVLIHLTGEALRTGSPVVEVEDSMTAFVRSLGLDANGRSIRVLKDQLARLSAATVRLGFVTGDHAAQVNTHLISAFDMWFPKDAAQRVLWPSSIRLSDAYFDSLRRHAVPLDHRAVGALAGSALALDCYAWLAQRLHRVPDGGQFITWPALQEQFGPDYSRIRKFREKYLVALRAVLSVYPAAKVEADARGIRLHRSRPPVAPRLVQVGRLPVDD